MKSEKIKLMVISSLMLMPQVALSQVPADTGVKVINKGFKVTYVNYPDHVDIETRSGTKRDAKQIARMKKEVVENEFRMRDAIAHARDLSGLRSLAPVLARYAAKYGAKLKEVSVRTESNEDVSSVSYAYVNFKLTGRVECRGLNEKDLKTFHNQTSQVIREWTSDPAFEEEHPEVSVKYLGEGFFALASTLYFKSGSLGDEWAEESVERLMAQSYSGIRPYGRTFFELLEDLKGNANEECGKLTEAGYIKSETQRLKNKKEARSKGEVDERVIEGLELAAPPWYRPSESAQ